MSDLACLHGSVYCSCMRAQARQVAAAEARGRQQGHTEMIEALRDTEAYFRWTHRIPGLVGTIHAPGLEVDYLEAVAAWITKDVEHTTEGSR